MILSSLNRYTFIFICFILICLFSLPIRGEEHAADSVSYHTLRSRLNTKDELNATVLTADALAKEGLFEEAVEILLTVIDTSGPTIDTVQTPTTSGKERHWRLSAGGDYYHLEDVDTLEMTPDEYDAYQRLMQTPASVWERAKHTIEYEHKILRRIAPEAYVSNYRTSLEIPLQLQLIPENLALEVSTKLGKWFQEDGSSDSTFAMVHGHSSDMGGAAVRLTAENSVGNTGRWSWAAPFAVDWEHYRRNRPGYESFIEYRLSPGVEYRPGGEGGLSTRFTGELRFEDYYHPCTDTTGSHDDTFRPVSDTMDALRGMVHLESSLRGGSGMLQLKAVWFSDNYVDASSPASVNRWKMIVRGRHALFRSSTFHITAHALYEREDNTPDASSDQPSVLPGTEFLVRPSLSFSPFRLITLEPELEWRRRGAEKTGIYYLWWAYSSWEPGLRIQFSCSVTDLIFIAGFCWEDIASGFESDIPDNRNIHLLFDGQVAISPNISLNLMCDYQYRIYSSSRITENLTAAGSILFTH